GQRGGGQLGTVGFQRVEHSRGVAARVLGRQTPLVEYTGRQEGGGQYLDVAVERQRLPDGAPALLHGRETPPWRRERQHRRDDLQALEPQHLFDQVRGLAKVRTPTRRSGRHRVAVGDHACADLG